MTTDHSSKIDDRLHRGSFPQPHEAPLSARSIFRTLLIQEIREGRLTPSRRKRIIRYAAKLDLSAVEVGEWIAEYQEATLGSSSTDQPTLRLVTTDATQPDNRLRPLGWTKSLLRSYPFVIATALSGFLAWRLLCP
ncbi:MAG: hypothetical protein AABZ47_06500 [Planctomycetota bacterium]